MAIGWFCMFKRYWATSLLLLGQLTDEVAHALQSHIITVEIEAQREVGIGGPQMQGDQLVNGSFLLSGIILTNMGGHGSSSTRS